MTPNFVGTRNNDGLQFVVKQPYGQLKRGLSSGKLHRMDSNQQLE
jgi:hypothetical protein